MERAALYIRVSTEEQAMHGYSLEAQRDALTQYAHKHDMLIVDYYTDEGFSARKTYTTRPACVRMLEDVKAGKIDTILFIKLDRWFRNVKDYYKVQEILEKYHVNWKTIFEDYDTSTASGRLHINIALSIAQDESDRTSERIKFVFADKVRRHEFTTGVLPMGFRLENKHLVPGESAAAVREIFNYYEIHQSKYATIKHMREDFDLNITECTMRHILTNPLYIGKYQDVDDFCEPIISQEQFDRVQEINASRSVRRPKTNEIYLFASLVICSECNHHMVGYRTLQKGIMFRYYRCNQYAARRLCPNSRLINEKNLEQYLLDNVCRLSREALTQYEVQAAAARKKPKIDRSKLQDKLTRLKDLYVDGLIDKDTYRKDYDKIQTQLAEIQEPQEKLPQVNIEKLRQLSDESVLSSYGSLNREEKRAFWRGFIKCIRVDALHNITIIFD